MSPETLLQNAGQGGGTPAADFWSLGVTLCELLTGEHPFRGRTHLDTLRNIARPGPAGAWRPSAAALARLRPSAVSLLAGLLSKDPARRLGADAAGGVRRLMRHRFFRLPAGYPLVDGPCLRSAAPGEEEGEEEEEGGEWGEEEGPDASAAAAAAGEAEDAGPTRALDWGWVLARRYRPLYAPDADAQAIAQAALAQELARAQAPPAPAAAAATPAPAPEPAEPAPPHLLAHFDAAFTSLPLAAVRAALAPGYAANALPGLGHGQGHAPRLRGGAGEGERASRGGSLSHFSFAAAPSFAEGADVAAAAEAALADGSGAAEEEEAAAEDEAERGARNAAGSALGSRSRRSSSGSSGGSSSGSSGSSSGSSSSFFDYEAEYEVGGGDPL